MSTAKDAYRVVPQQPLGAAAYGIDIKKDISPEVIQSLKDDVHQYSVFVLKDQGVIPGERQMEITRWFGEIDLPGYEKHPKSPDRRVLRVSNDDNEGYRDFGTAGFHVDGSYMELPNPYSIYHIVSVPRHGSTVFVSFMDLIDALSEERRQKWERLWVAIYSVTFRRLKEAKEEPSYVVHPLTYNHPVVGRKTLCIHLGKLYAFIWDKGSPNERWTDKKETEEIKQEIISEIHRDNDKHIYYHKWEAGDLVLSDNLAVGHMASPDTQRPVEEVGLRVMHRTITLGTSKPSR